MRIGLGPVFAYEWLVTSRRWQVYAVRSLFVSILLVGLALVWWSNDSERSRTTVQGQAEVAEGFYGVIVGTQLILLLLAAPAATAGAVCLDKSRGTLTHLLVTDLSNAEIILGKLAARLIPVLILVASALPALALGSLLGGIDPQALTGAFLISLGVATFGSALALAFSVWGTKVHDVLMATYTVLIVWVLAKPMLWLWRMANGWGPRTPQWLGDVNPFELAFASSWRTGQVDLGQDLLFLAKAWGVSAVLVGLAVLRVRAVAARQFGQGVRHRRRWWLGEGGRRSPKGSWLRLGPQLDPNPVLWREWHRRRPSRWGRILWAVYTVAAILVCFSSLSFIAGGTIRPQAEVSLFFNGGLVALGFLFLSITSATSLSEERNRGSLDVLLATPMSTTSIVLGKWWGAFRGTLLLAILPGIVTLTAAFQHGYWFGFLLIIGLLIAFGAALTSLGLAIGTWSHRQGRVLTITVTAYLLVTIGWPMFCALLGSRSSSETWESLALASPLFSNFIPPLHMLEMRLNNPDWWKYYPTLMFWIVVYSIAAIGLLIATLMTFDRCLGRVSERFASRPIPKRSPKPVPLLMD